jgi:hypothetical protein
MDLLLIQLHHHLHELLLLALSLGLSYTMPSQVVQQCGRVHLGEPQSSTLPHQLGHVHSLQDWALPGGGGTGSGGQGGGRGRVGGVGRKVRSYGAGWRRLHGSNYKG